MKLAVTEECYKAASIDELDLLIEEVYQLKSFASFEKLIIIEVRAESIEEQFKFYEGESYWRKVLEPRGETYLDDIDDLSIIMNDLCFKGHLEAGTYLLKPRHY